MSNDESTASGFIAGVIVAAALIFLWVGVSSDLERVGNFYVANESQGWVVRMDNANGNATNITKPVATPEEASRLANEFNHTLSGHENK